MAAHFGRCAGFAVFDIDGQVAKRVEFRPQIGHHHAHAAAGEGHHHASHADDHHGSLIGLLWDCGVVVTRGMGRRAVADLAANGIAPSIVVLELSPQEAADRYARGELRGSSESSCCSH